MTNLKTIFALLLFAVFISKGYSFNYEIGQDTVKKPTFFLAQPDPTIDKMDSMLVVMFSANPALKFESNLYDIQGFGIADTPKYSNEVYAERIGNINSPMPYVYNEKVQGFINLYVNRRREQMSRMLALSQQYFPMFEEELDRNNMPIELKYLPVIESALNTNAVSKAGASGLWQFMLGTGKLMGLKIDSYVDERRDPLMATKAGCAYLKQLHGIYDDWFLAIAAYNCGPGNVNKALRKKGNKEGLTYWDIYDFLPKETRGYVPAFIAATYAFEYHKEHNIKPIEFGYKYDLVDTIMITKKMTLSQIAPYLQMTEDEIALYNPSLKTKTIPGSPVPFPLRLPVKAMALFYANQEALFASLIKPIEAAYVAASTTKIEVLEANTDDTDPNTKTIISYTVKKGDNLGYISDWFDCSVAEIKKWNSMKSTTIVPGQKLKIEVIGSKKTEYASINQMTTSQKQKLTGIEIVGQPVETKTIEPTIIYYTVKSGDTLWSISKKYPENSIDEIRVMNEMAKNETLKTGTKIKLVK